MGMTLSVDFVLIKSSALLIDLNIVWLANISVTISCKNIFAIL